MEKIEKYWSENLTVTELSGAFGDMGTLLPILVSLTQGNQISLTVSLIFGGIFNIIAGFWFNIPMCVQPMKSIAAIALLGNLPQAEIMSAGIAVAAIVLFLSITGLMQRLNNFIPLSIIRGIQLGVGLSLLSKGIQLVQKSYKWEFMQDKWMDNYVIAGICLFAVLLTWRAKFSITAILLLFVGLLVSFYRSGWELSPISLDFPIPSVPNALDFYNGFMKAGLGQLPLTVLNSVIAVSALADDLFPHKNRPVASVTQVGIFLGMMNLIGGWFGCVPYCCGSGGLAAQYRFGSRTGLSIILLGIFKLVLGLCFGQSLLNLFKSIPASVLGIMLVVAGLQLALVTMNLGSFKTIKKHEDAYFIMLLTAATIVGFANDGLGFLVGCATATIFSYLPEHKEDPSLSDSRSSMISTIE
jgi:MFS superfamily sulfate permease-like transporter